MFMRYVNQSKDIKIVSKDYFIDDYKVTSMFFPAGSWLTMEYVGEGVASDLASKHIVIYGNRVCENDVLPPLTTGHMTEFDNYVIPPGTYKRTTIVDTYQWCIKHKVYEDQQISATSVKIEPNEVYTLNVGKKAYFLDGSIIVSEQTINTPQVLVPSQTRQLTAVTKTYMFVW